MKSRRYVLISLALLLTCLSLAYAQFGGGRRFRPNPQQTTEALNATLEDVFETARDSTVRIETTPSGIGSGFIISDDGLIMTAYHVVRQANALNVVFTDGERYRAELVGFDEYSDVALLDIEAQDLAALPIDFNDTPEPGDSVLAIGNSRGQFNAPRAGQVIALDQVLDANFPDSLIGSTLPLAPGDSGGPVLDSDGEVVGVAVAVSVGPGGYSSFATPLFGSEAGEVIAALEGGLQRGVPFMGVSLMELTPQAVANLNYGQPGGLLITNVVPGSGAAAAGLQNPETAQTRVRGRGRTGIVTTVEQADIIVGVDGRQVSNYDDLLGYLRGLDVGDTVMLSILRGGVSQDISVTLGTRSL